MVVPSAVSLVGCGVIGRGWIRVFARSQAEVRLDDASPDTCRRAIEWLGQDLAADISDGFITATERDIVLAHVEVAHGLADALSGVTYVQESIPRSSISSKSSFASSTASPRPMSFSPRRHLRWT